MMVAKTFRVCWLLCMILIQSGCKVGDLNEQPVEGARLAITNVTVIDVTGGPSRPDTTVLIAGERITVLGETDVVKIPQDVPIVDAQGKYLIPGLLDMHVHLQDIEPLFSLFIANGVTGVREMGGGPHENIERWRELGALGERLIPRILAAGQIVNGPKPAFPGALVVSDDEEGRRAVTSLRQRGLDFLKVFSLLPRDGYFAIAEEANRQGFPFAGHLPISVSAAEASDAGQSSIEHLAGSGLLFACSTREAELRRSALKALEESDYDISVVAESILFGPVEELIGSYSYEKADALFASFINNGTLQVPTLAGRRVDTGHFVAPDDPRLDANGDENYFLSDPYLKYVPDSMKDEWFNPYTKNFTGEDFSRTRKLFRKQLELVGDMRVAGVEFMTGSDAGNPGAYPGFTLHDELALFVDAGFSPIEALQSATLIPASFLGVSGSLGTIEEGKIADLLLLEANPLESIENTRKIAGVVFKGEFFSKSKLADLLMVGQGSVIE